MPTTMTIPAPIVVSIPCPAPDNEDGEPCFGTIVARVNAFDFVTFDLCTACRREPGHHVLTTGEEFGFDSPEHEQAVDAYDSAVYRALVEAHKRRDGTCAPCNGSGRAAATDDSAAGACEACGGTGRPG